jgi:hypothetical protein
VLAEGEVADEILCRVQRLSADFGTQMTIDNGRGIIASSSSS